MECSIPKIDFSEQKEVTIPEKRETFEAQVLVISKARKEMQFTYAISANIYNPLYESARIIQSGKFKVELIHSSLANGKPTILITEE